MGEDLLDVALGEKTIQYKSMIEIQSYFIGVVAQGWRMHYAFRIWQCFLPKQHSNRETIPTRVLIISGVEIVFGNLRTPLPLLKIQKA